LYDFVSRARGQIKIEAGPRFKNQTWGTRPRTTLSKSKLCKANWQDGGEIKEIWVSYESVREPRGQISFIFAAHEQYLVRSKD